MSTLVEKIVAEINERDRWVKKYCKSVRVVEIREKINMMNAYDAGQDNLRKNLLKKWEKRFQSQFAGTEAKWIDVEVRNLLGLGESSGR